MSACKTLIRTSLSCVEFRARTPNSKTLNRFPSSPSNPPSTLPIKPSNLSFDFPLAKSGLRIRSHKPFSISRSFGSSEGVFPMEIPEITEEDTAAPQASRNDTVRELLSKDKDDISRLMKMERRVINGQGLRDDKKQRWFPYLDKWESGDSSYLNSSEVLEAIDPYIMDVRKGRFRNAVNNRSYSVCLVVEGLTDLGNVSAAFRSADALGIQSVHVVSRDSSKRYKDNRHVSMGAEKWLDIELWDSVGVCFENLKARGYRIATAHLGTDAVSVYDVDWSCPTAIVVGNERRGVSEEALELSDLHCSIPMRGMVDSFNVSVAAGLLMHQAVCDRTLRMGCHGDLTQEERQILLAEFYLRHNENAIRITNEFSKRKLAGPASKL